MWKVVNSGCAGVVCGALLGFVVVYLVVAFIGQTEARPFGEMTGVAAIDLGLFVGVPVGGLALGTLGVWRAVRRGKRSHRSTGAD